MNLLKRVIGIMCVIVIASTCLQNVSAYNVGDVIGEVVYTDIIASINGKKIPSYNMNGYTMIAVEDLRDYGFNVIWVEHSRSLRVYLSSSKAVSKSYTPEIDRSKIGTKAADVLYTDIVTYFNKSKVDSYNIGGKTVVNFNELSAFGDVVYNNYTRCIDFYPLGSETWVINAFENKIGLNLYSNAGGYSAQYNGLVREMWRYSDRIVAFNQAMVYAGYEIISSKKDKAFDAKYIESECILKGETFRYIFQKDGNRVIYDVKVRAKSMDDCTISFILEFR